MYNIGHLTHVLVCDLPSILPLHTEKNFHRQYDEE